MQLDQQGVGIHGWVDSDVRRRDRETNLIERGGALQQGIKVRGQYGAQAVPPGESGDRAMVLVYIGDVDGAKYIEILGAGEPGNYEVGELLSAERLQERVDLKSVTQIGKAF